MNLRSTNHIHPHHTNAGAVFNVVLFLIGMGVALNERRISSVLVEYGQATTVSVRRSINTSFFSVSNTSRPWDIAILPQRIATYGDSAPAAQNDTDGGMAILHLDHDEDSRPKHLRLVMVGDSLTRYQYTSLTYFLKTATWFNTTGEPNIVWERGHYGWNHFFEHTTNLLSPKERCDCYRPKHLTRNNKKTMMENRYFFDDDRDNMVVFLQAFGHTVPMQGRVPPKTALRNISGCTFVHEWSNYTWSYKDWDDCVKSYISRLVPKPTHAIFNAGAHAHSFAEHGVGSRLIQALNDTGILGIWKTTSYERPEPVNNNTRTQGRGNKESEYIMTKLFHPHVLDVGWTSKVRPEFYADLRHFLEPVYRIINEATLEMLGHTFPSMYEKQNMSEVLMNLY
jgi:hypothetical protein